MIQLSWLLAAFLLVGAAVAQKELKMRYGQSATLRCDVGVNRPPDMMQSIKWYKGNREIGEGEVYKIPKAEVKDSGNYTCSWLINYNGKTVRRSKYVIVYVTPNGLPDLLPASALQIEEEEDFNIGGGLEEFNPTIVIKDKTGQELTSLSIMETAFVYLICEATGIPPDSYTISWESPLGKKISKNNILYVSNIIMAEHNGRFRCIVTRTSDSTTKSQYLNVKIRPFQVKIKAMPGHQTSIGQKTMLSCIVDAPGSNDIWDYAWTDPNGKQVGTSPLLQMVIMGTSPSGQYKCTVTGRKSRSTRSNGVNFMVSGGGSVDYVQGLTVYALNVRVEPKTIVMKGQLRLIAEVSPPLSSARYEWSFAGGIIGRSKIHIIPSFEVTSMGVYTVKVTGTNRFGRIETLTKPVNVEILRNQQKGVELSPPPGPTIAVHIGDRKELHCEVDPTLQPRAYGRDVVWYKDNQLIRPGDMPRLNAKRMDMKYVSILTLQSIIDLNQGEYRCMVRGIAKQGYIVIVQQPFSFEMNPEKQYSSVGEMSEFHCKIEQVKLTADQVIWHFEARSGNRVRVPVDFRRWKRIPSVGGDSYFIQLDNTQLFDDGFYFCTIPTGQTAKGELVVTGGGGGIIDYEVIVTPSIITIRPRKYFTVKCLSRRTDNGAPFGDAVFVFEDGTRVEARDRRFVQNSRAFGISEMIVAGGLETRDTNTRIYCKVGTKRKLVTIVIEDTNSCPPGHRRCRSGECLHNSKFCDGVHDCRDRSDEDPTQCNMCDPLTRKCEYHAGKAPIKKDFQIHWLCDGEDDCGNNFDESKCFGHYATCGGLRHTCRGQPGTIIPRAFMCDKENDCPMRDDEQGCEDPNVYGKRSDIRNKQVRLGDRVVLECEASGTPLPRIVWRFNWYCLPDTLRMMEHVEYIDCAKTKSRLTITGFRSGDDGIYNCEAISGQKRALSEDYLITVASGFNPNRPWGGRSWS